MLFTPEELEEMRRADAEIEASFCQTPEETRAPRIRDQAVKLGRLDNRRIRIAEYQRAYSMKPTGKRSLRPSGTC